MTSARGEPEDVKQAREAKDEAIVALLAKLALHYWRPDFTEGQARQLYLDYLDDLRDYAVADIKTAIQAYRTDGTNKFFPSSGQIIDSIIGKADLIREYPPNGPSDMLMALRKRSIAAKAAGTKEMGRKLLSLTARQGQIAG